MTESRADRRSYRNLQDAKRPVVTTGLVSGDSVVLSEPPDRAADRDFSLTSDHIERAVRSTDWVARAKGAWSSVGFPMIPPHGH